MAYSMLLLYVTAVKWSLLQMGGGIEGRFGGLKLNIYLYVSLRK